MSQEPAFSTRDLAGRYAYKFAGYAISNNILHYLVGVGQFEIKDDGKLAGQHKSSITPIQGQAAKLQTGGYELKGTVTLEASGVGSASINFKSKSTHGLDVKGEFHVQVAGATDRLWFISAGATLPTQNNIPADEIVTLEAIRMT